MSCTVISRSANFVQQYLLSSLLSFLPSLLSFLPFSLSLLPPPSLPSSTLHPPLKMLFFNFNERPSELFDKVVEIKVLNAKRLIRDALIGSFKVGGV